MKNRKPVILISIAVFIFGVVYLLMADKGIFKFYKLKGEVDSLKTEVEALKKENRKLYMEIDSLGKKVPAKMEEIAREKHNMKMKNEIKIKVEEE